VGGPGDPIHLGFEERGLRPPNVRMNCESFTTLLALLPSLDALALVPQAFLHEFAKGHAVVELPIQDPLPKIKVYSAWRADAPVSTQMAFLLDAIEAEAHELELVRT
jgi:LysR family transcriptional regulator, regulator of abg operon